MGSWRDDFILEPRWRLIVLTTKNLEIIFSAIFSASFSIHIRRQQEKMITRKDYGSIRVSIRDQAFELVVSDFDKKKDLRLISPKQCENRYLSNLPTSHRR